MAAAYIAGPLRRSTLTAAMPGRTCNYCSWSLPSQFFLLSGSVRACLCCDNERLNRRNAAAAPPAEMLAENICAHCGEVKAAADFQLHKGNPPDGLHSSCRDCVCAVSGLARARWAAVPAQLAALLPTMYCAMCHMEKRAEF